LNPAQKKAVFPPQFQAVLREESVFRKVSEEGWTYGLSIYGVTDPMTMLATQYRPRPTLTVLITSRREGISVMRLKHTVPTVNWYATDQARSRPPAAQDAAVECTSETPPITTRVMHIQMQP
jgi:hypothetical protein